MNNAFGYQALTSNLNGSANNAFGYQSLALNANSSNNAFGYRALAVNTVGSLNNAFGYLALAKSTNSDYNNAFGSSTLASNTTGNRNNAFGYQSLISNISGSYNTAIGDNANSSSVNNLYSTAIGAYTYINASYSTAIGYNASTSTNNQIVLGTEAETTYVPGNLSATFITAKNISTDLIIANNMSVYSINFKNLSNSEITVTNQVIATNTVFADKSVYNFNITNPVSLINNVSRYETTTNSYFGEKIVMSRNGETLAIGSPKYDSNKGRLDIYRTGFTDPTTVIGDAVNSYFGTNIVVSDDGNTVLMGSPNYRGGNGIFNQFYNGTLNFSAVGPIYGMAYGANMYFDYYGNSVMFSNGYSANTTHYTLYGISPDATKQLKANMYKSIYNTNEEINTQWAGYGFKTFVYFIAVDIFNRTSSLTNRAMVIASDTTPRFGGPVLSQGLSGFGYFDGSRTSLYTPTVLADGVLSTVTSSVTSTQNYNYYNAAITTAQPGIIELTNITTTSLQLKFNFKKLDGTDPGCEQRITISSAINTRGAQLQVNNSNVILIWVPPARQLWIYKLNPTPNPSFTLLLTEAAVTPTIVLLLSYDDFRLARTGYGQGSQNLKITNVFSVGGSVTEVLTGYIPDYTISDGITKTYYTPKIAMNSNGTTLVASSPYKNLIQVYKDYSSINVTAPSIINISGLSTYGENIAIDSTGNILASSSPYYNSSSGYVQQIDLTENEGLPNKYISNISTLNTNQRSLKSINNVFNVNNSNVLSTTTNYDLSVTNIETSIYGEGSTLINSSNNVSTTEIYNGNGLVIGGDSSFTRINIGGINTTTIGIGGHALALNTNGMYNTGLGYGTSITGGASNSTVIGANASTSTSNQIVLGTAAETVVLYNPPIMAYSSFTAPTNSIQVGCIVNSTGTWGQDAVTGSTPEPIRDLSLGLGVWMIIGHAIVKPNSVSTGRTFITSTGISVSTTDVAGFRVVNGVSANTAGTRESEYVAQARIYITLGGSVDENHSTGSNHTYAREGIYEQSLTLTRVVNVTSPNSLYRLYASCYGDGAVTNDSLYATRIA